MEPEDALLADTQDLHKGTVGVQQVQVRMQTGTDHQEGVNHVALQHHGAYPLMKKKERMNKITLILICNAARPSSSIQIHFKMPI